MSLRLNTCQCFCLLLALPNYNIFHYISCLKLLPIRVCGVVLCPRYSLPVFCTFCRTSSLVTMSTQLIFSILPQTHNSKAFCVSLVYLHLFITVTELKFWLWTFFVRVLYFLCTVQLCSYHCRSYRMKQKKYLAQPQLDSFWVLNKSQLPFFPRWLEYDYNQITFVIKILVVILLISFLHGVCFRLWNV